MEKQPTPLFFFFFFKNKVLSERVKITAAVPLLQVCTQRSLERLLTVTGWSLQGSQTTCTFCLVLWPVETNGLRFPLMDTQPVWAWSSFLIWTVHRASVIYSSWPESWACFHLRDSQYSGLWKNSFSGLLICIFIQLWNSIILSFWQLLMILRS